MSYTNLKIPKDFTKLVLEINDYIVEIYYK